VHDDGDVEDLDEAETRTAIKHHKDNIFGSPSLQQRAPTDAGTPTSRATSASGRKRTVVNYSEAAAFDDDDDGMDDEYDEDEDGSATKKQKKTKTKKAAKKRGTTTMPKTISHENVRQYCSIESSLVCVGLAPRAVVIPYARHFRFERNGLTSTTLTPFPRTSTFIAPSPP
jgi:hypothetical protein